MKTKSKKPFLNMDERNKQIAYKVMAVMYLITIVAMQGVVLYRQFALGQNIHDFEDIAIIMTINSLFLVSALLYFGAVQLQKLKIKSIILFYIGFVTLGSLFTYAKYNLFGNAELSFSQLLGKLEVIAAIIAIIMGFWILLSYLGKRKLEKELE
jgi:hypothetical protein